MYFEEIDGERQLDFVRKFDYIREAGTEGEQKAAVPSRKSSAPSAREPSGGVSF